jgi:hypothetical protein
MRIYERPCINTMNVAHPRKKQRRSYLWLTAPLRNSAETEEENWRSVMACSTQSERKKERKKKGRGHE